MLAAFFIAVLFFSVSIHELAHAATATGYRVDVARVEINMAGGLASFRGWPRTMQQDLLITAAGPLSNLALGLAALALPMLVPAPAPEMIGVNGKLVPEPFTQPSMAAQLLRATAYVNIGLFVVNLLPGILLDGGKIVYLPVEQRWHSRTALLTVSSLGLFFAAVNTYLLIGTIIAGLPIWAPPTFGTNWEAFKAARHGRRANGDAVAFRGFQPFLNGLLRNFEPFSP
ncbi:MAG: site-2 protease family protein [Xanthobacteraceae bacterium]|nr:site-2 protease family protein [Xanthobacteraceae bacterium]